MLRNLYADTRKTLYSRGFHIGTILVIAFNIVYAIYELILCKIFGGYITTEELSFAFNGIAIFAVTASTLIIADKDYADGCIRNKLISGVARSETFVSAVFGGMLQGAVYTLVAFLSSNIIALFASSGYLEYTVSEIGTCWLITLMTCIAIGAFSTTLVMVFGGSKIAYVVGLTIAFGMKLLVTVVQDKLYPSNGLCKLKGTKLLIYRCVDSYVPYSYLSAFPHQKFVNYFVGCFGLSALSIVIGLIIFAKKEIK